MREILRTGYYRLVEGRHGRFLANPLDTYIGRALIEYGEFSELEWRLFQRLVQKDAVVVEAGANIGAFTVPLAKAVGEGGLVYAFEPQPLIFQQLCANLALNDLVNVQAINAGCGAENTVIGIARVHPGRETNFGAVRLRQVTVEQRSVTVPVRRLDDAIDPPRLSFLKADVEGMEGELLRGAAGLIAKFRPILYLECNREESEALIAQVLGLDYACWWHAPPLFNPGNFAGKAENLYPGIASFNILCAPAERKLRVEGLPPVKGPDDHPLGRGKA